MEFFWCNNIINSDTVINIIIIIIASICYDTNTCTCNMLWCMYCTCICIIIFLLDLRSQIKPSLAVQELLEAVIIIVKSPTADLSWTKGAKRLMANVDRFGEMLMEFSQNQGVS